MLGFGKQEESESSSQQSDYDKALEDEYYLKSNAMIFEDLSDDEWNRCNERLKEIKQEWKRQ